MAILTYISIATLNINGLNDPVEYKNKTHIYAVYKKPASDLKTYIDWKWEDRKIYPMQMEIQRKLEKQS